MHTPIRIKRWKCWDVVARQMILINSHLRELASRASEESALSLLMTIARVQHLIRLLAQELQQLRELSTLNIRQELNTLKESTQSPSVRSNDFNKAVEQRNAIYTLSHCGICNNFEYGEQVICLNHQTHTCD